MHQLPIIARKEVAENTLEVTFDVRGKTCVFRPGQYLTVMLPELKFPDPKGNSRVFSIASSPDNKESISIVFRLSGSGFKQTLSELPIGSLVTADCCWGNFTLPEDSSAPLVFVAGGVGVAPFMSSIRFVVEEKLPHRITLIYANKDKASAMYLAELEDIAAHNKNVTLKTVFGAVDRAILDECVQQQKDAKWFVAGPAVMVNTVQASLHELGVPSIRIHSEEFAGYVDLGGEKAYDSRTELVEQSLLGISDGALKGIITALNDAILISVTDVSGTITYANDMFVRVSKYPREELIGQNHRLLKSEKHSPEFYAELWRTVSSGKIWRGEVKNRAKDGTFYWVDATIAPIVDEKGMVNGYLAARIPIDKKKELEDRNRMFSNIIQETSQPWGMSDLEGKFVEVNHAFIDFLGYSFDELKQKNYMDLISPEYRDAVMAGMGQIQTSGESFVSEVVFLKKDATKAYVDLMINYYYHDGAPTHIYAFITDITKQKLLEIELTEHASEVEQMNRLMVDRELKMIELKEELEKCGAHHKAAEKSV